MSKLQMLKPRVQMVKAQRVNTVAETARTRGGSWMRIRAKWLREHPMCCKCQEEGALGIVATELDHVIPLSQGGRDDESNYQSLCYSHHKAKTAEEAKARK